MANRISLRLDTYLLLILAVWAGGGCTRESLGDMGETISLAVSVKNVLPGQEGATKMTEETTQSGGVFRGVEKLYIVPFATLTSEVEPGTPRLGGNNVRLGNVGISQDGLVENNNSHLFGSATVPNGMNHVLVYGKTPDAAFTTTKDGKHRFGVLSPKGLENPSGSDAISFHLEPAMAVGKTVNEVQEAQDVADYLLEQLNVVMSIMGTSKFPAIVNIFDVVKRENQILACSYPTFDYFRNEIQTALLRIPFESMDLVQEIGRVSQAVSAFSTALNAVGGTFPASYGIPEGAFGFWWNGKEFVRMVSGVNIALIDPASYCYPPSLWYYANSTIQTSVDETVREQYVAANAQWDDVLVHYADGGTVSTFTESVAITDPLQYGVGLMSLSLGTPGPVATELINGCPLTGIIIGGQKDVDFRFLPDQGPSRYIYDSVVDGVLRIGSTGTTTHTLVLETPVDAPVYLALEFRNNTGYKRWCQQGEILPRSKFYVVGVLDAPSGGSVFSRDHRTSVTIRIKGPQNAYTTVPDLHSPQLEIGMVAEMKWNQITPQSLILEY